MKVLLIGNGGREHALAWKLAQSELVERVYVAPGNGGTAHVPKTENVPIGSSRSEFEALARFAAAHGVTLAVPGPEQPLVEGISEVLQAHGVPVFGPSTAAARMEGSKTFSKDFMARHNIPTARFRNFSDYVTAKAYLEHEVDYKVVIKAGGLAGGKGVLMPESKAEALEALAQVMQKREFGSAGDDVVIEECLEGDELSVLSLTDGYTMVDLPPAQDHKRAGDGDTGLNTGGMGAYAPAPIATPAVIAQIRSEILEPTIRGMRRDGYPLVGVLFTGIMLTAQGPKVLEYNVRFGDPEIQTVVGLLESDLAEVLLACVDRRLDSVSVRVASGYGATVVIAAGGYPQSYAKGDEITVGALPQHVQVFHAGTAMTDGKVVTSGGRVLAVSAVAPTLREAVDRAYEGVSCVSFRNMYSRKDIAHRAFRAAAAADEGTAVTYEAAGVSVDAGNQFVEQIKAKVASTRRPGADAAIGGFGGIFDLAACNYTDPLLVSATDGVGTKLKIAQAIDKHDTVGIDLVAMSVNDLVVQGAEPLFFLDYFASGHLVPRTAAAFVGGVADGCRESGCALVGGETAEMPGLYSGTDYDVNGTCVGAVERTQVLPKLESMSEGDVLLGLASSGVHSNGFSLVRKILQVNGLEFTDTAPWTSASGESTKSIGESLLEPTRIYVKPLLQALRENVGAILGLAHITGGGLVENVPRILPSSLDAEIDVTTWSLPPLFSWLGRAGRVPVADISKTLNMGIGMVLVVRQSEVDSVVRSLSAAGERVTRLGTLKAGSGRCNLLNTAEWY